MNDLNVVAVRWVDGRLGLLDQRRLPREETWLDIPDADAAGRAIADLVVRGAPAIGITAAYAAVLAARQRGDDLAGWHADLERLAAARPTAVNLAWALERMRRRAGDRLDAPDLEREAVAIHAEDVVANRAMAEQGSGLFVPGSGVITHCNTGGLATGGIGTALGVIVAGHRAGRVARVYAGETRPWLQGSRLTAWELAREGVPARVIVEGAAASLMRAGEIDWVVTGADRICANGDVVNKIGTYMLARLAADHGVGMMVVAPWSTVDPATATGDDVPIETRSGSEIWTAAGLEDAPDGITGWNPVFDVTPAEFVTAIVTERGVIRPPFNRGISALAA